MTTVVPPESTVPTTALRDCYLRAHDLATRGDVSGAIRALEEMLPLERLLALVRNDAAALRYTQGERSLAIEHLEQAVRLDGTHLNAHKNLADLYLETGDRSRAEGVVKAALERWPDDPDCRRQLADLSRQPPAAAPGASPRFVSFSEQLNALAIARAVTTVVKGRTGRTELRFAHLGRTDISAQSEALTDFGLVNPGWFAGDPNDPFHPSRPFEELDPQAYDLIFIGDRDPARAQQLAAAYRTKHGATAGAVAVEIDLLAAAHLRFLHGFSGPFASCLNPHKLSMLVAALYLAPRSGCVVEAGVAFGGTTVFMATLQRILGISRPIYALDTFAGMPEPVEKDYGGGFVYTSDFFRDVSLEGVKRHYQEKGVASDIRIEKGLVQETLPRVLEQTPQIAFMLLDTDQYAGTKGGLDHALPHLAPGGLIIVDDTTVHGVNLAIEEALSKHPGLRRASLTTNFDLLSLSST